MFYSYYTGGNDNKFTGHLLPWTNEFLFTAEDVLWLSMSHRYRIGYALPCVFVHDQASCRASRTTVSGYFLAGRSMMFYTVRHALDITLRPTYVKCSMTLNITPIYTYLMCRYWYVKILLCEDIDMWRYCYVKIFICEDIDMWRYCEAIDIWSYWYVTLLCGCGLLP